MVHVRSCRRGRSGELFKIASSVLCSVILDKTMTNFISVLDGTNLEETGLSNLKLDEWPT